MVSARNSARLLRMSGTRPGAWACAYLRLRLRGWYAFCPHAELFEYDTRDRLLATLYTTSQMIRIEQLNCANRLATMKRGIYCANPMCTGIPQSNWICRDTGSDYYTYGFGVGHSVKVDHMPSHSANIQGPGGEILSMTPRATLRLRAYGSSPIREGRRFGQLSIRCWIREGRLFFCAGQQSA